MGFITRKLVAKDGSISWSAPLFTKGISLSLGITLGYLNCDICLALMNDDAIHAALGASFGCGITGDFLVDMNGAKLRKVQLDSTWTPDNVVTDRHGGMFAKYFRLTAMMIDASIKGGRVGPWDEMNTALYGENYNSADVLGGKFPRPIEILPVHDMLARYSVPAKSVGITRTGSQKGSQFKLDRSVRAGTSNSQKGSSDVAEAGPSTAAPSAPAADSTNSAAVQPPVPVPQ